MLILSVLFLEIVPDIGMVGLIAGAAFFLVFAGVAYIAFRMMRKTVKIALRMALAAGILLIAIVGSIAIYWKTSTGNAPRQKPTVNRNR